MIDMNMTKKIGICAHSYEGGSLCFITACREGAKIMGAHMHPNIVMSAIPMGLSMPAWEANNYEEVAIHLQNGVDQIAKGGAEFFICPDNTAHIVLEKIISSLPIPGLHIADVVSQEIKSNGWRKVGLLGTKWTMSGNVYRNILKENNLSVIIPDTSTRAKINNAIFEELCQGIFSQNTIALFIDAIDNLKKDGAECVILGCTEIPLIINAENSSLPVLDSTRLLAEYAVKYAVSKTKIPSTAWIKKFD